MTPERLEEIRKTYYDPEDPNSEWRVPVGQHINNAEELLEEVDRLREALSEILYHGISAPLGVPEDMNWWKGIYRDCARVAKEAMEAKP